MSYMPMCDVIIVSTISRMLRSFAAVVITILYVRWSSWARLCCVKSCRIFPRDQAVHLTEKSVLRDVKWENFILYWRRSGLKNPDKPKIFIKIKLKIIRTTSFIRFWRKSGLTEPGLTEVYCMVLTTPHCQQLAATQKLRQNTNYLQLCGMINWL